jgi:hypothetical protein
MTTEERGPMGLHRPQKANESFQTFSTAERERRLNSGEEFDPALFDAAVDLVMRKLEKLQEEGLA